MFNFLKKFAESRTAYTIGMVCNGLLFFMSILIVLAASDRLEGLSICLLFGLNTLICVSNLARIAK